MEDIIPVSSDGDRLADLSAVKVAMSREGNYLLMVPETGRWRISNRAGTEILGCCRRGYTFEDIVDLFSDAYDADRRMIENDVRECIQTLLDLVAPENRPLRDPPAISTYNLYLETTEACNLRCAHCFSPSRCEARDHGRLTTVEIKHMLDEAVENHITAITFSGGEFLLRGDWEELVRHAKLLGIKSSISTNGTLIDEHAAQVIAEYCDSCQVSLNGSRREIDDAIRGPGAFEATMKGLNFMAEGGALPKTMLMFTLMKPNIDDLWNMLRLARSLGVPLRLGQLMLSRWALKNQSWLFPTVDEEMSVFLDVKAEDGRIDPVDNRPGVINLVLTLTSNLLQHRGGCQPGRSLNVSYNGNVFVCSELAQPEHCLGNIRTHALRDILIHPLIGEFRDIRDARIERIDECRTCIWRSFCRAGCMGNVYARYGTFWRTSKQDCERMRYLIRRIFHDSLGKSMDNAK